MPLSCSVASNIPNYKDPKCFISTGDTQELVSRVIDYLNEISAAGYTILERRFEHVFKGLKDLMFSYSKVGDSEGGDSEGGETENDNTENDDKEKPDDTIGKLLIKLEGYLSQLPVIGFNSGKYDINLIKPYFIKYFVGTEEGGNKKPTTVVIDADRVFEDEKETDSDDDDDGPFNFVVKRNNNFMCISTETLKFLDIVNYLAPGFSYSKYLAAYKVKETKGFFCYEYIKNLDNLNETQLPPHSAFFSSLKNTNISVDEYALCQRVWVEEGMSTLKDFLVWYNNKDVVPFLKALKKQVKFYADLGVDMFKEAISVPGVTLKYLFKTLPPGVHFSLCSKRDADLHRTIRDNIVGGPSIIFHRYHEKGQTFIRGNKDKVVQGIKGYDANALYLWSLTQQMPTDFPVIRSSEDGFRPRKTNYY